MPLQYLSLFEVPSLVYPARWRSRVPLHLILSLVLERLQQDLLPVPALSVRYPSSKVSFYEQFINTRSACYFVTCAQPQNEVGISDASPDSEIEFSFSESETGRGNISMEINFNLIQRTYFRCL
jgi:hypothetical protein